MYNYWGGENILSPPHFSYWGGGAAPPRPPRFLRLCHIYVSICCKGIMHQGSALSPLLFVAELLYADDLVLMVMVGSSDGK